MHRVAALLAVPHVRRLLSELARVELIDRSLALGAQALLALIPLLMVTGAFLPDAMGSELLEQVRDLMGVRGDTLAPLRSAAVIDERPTEVGLLSLLVSLISATSFSRAMQRMYARVWELPTYRGLGAMRGSLVWIVGLVVMLQVTALLLGSMGGIPLDGLVRLIVQLTVNVGLWWWTARLLLGGRVSWLELLPGAVVCGASVVVLSRMSSVFMPRYASVNADQFGPLGVVFSVASWLVLLGGVLVLSSVVGRMLAEASGLAGESARAAAGGDD
ncbi:MAG: YhjD/YihY/BrkB family envelope integrity protein, partial [Nocardioidaceae bacterium]